MIKGLFFGIWLALYLAGMWTYSSTAFMYDQHIQFVFTTDVSWERFFSLRYVGDLQTDEDLLFSKIAHVFSSALLAFLFFLWLGLRTWTVAAMLIFVTTVEVVQEFFTRDARALDIVLNGTGVCIGVFAAAVWLLGSRKKSAEEVNV
ncbi:hypothetical protein [Alkalicoccus chagannorensis]|uniref:hypothetical protein n=1 Tax=Alkalicoccus chagannorensis TaxID=427072 RepID=UPI00040E9A9F|nr:hypothetical protein [Alkalicoccus chagannorensis]